MSRSPEEMGATSSQPSPRSAFQLVIDPIFGPFFWGKVLSAAGIWVHNIVAAIATFEITGSTLLVGVVSIVQFGPQLVLTPLSGKFADKGDPVRQIVVGRFVTAAGSIGLACWIWWIGGLENLLSIWPLILASLLVGIGFVLGGPAMYSIVPSLVRPNELATATALNGLPMIVARVAGPALGALIAIHLGYAAAFTVAGIGSAIFGSLVLRLHLDRRVKQDPDADYSILASFRYVRTDRPLILLLIAIAAVAVGADPAITLAPAIAAHLEGGSALVGWLASAFGLGAAAGFLLLRTAQKWFGLVPLASTGLATMAVGLLLLAVSWHPYPALLSFTIAGIGMTFAFTSISTQVQQRSPNRLRGRIMALWLVGFLGSRPLAAAINGMLADLFSALTAVFVTGLLLLLAARMCRPRNLPPVATGT